MDQNFIVTAALNVKEGNLKTVKNALKTLAEETRKEPGNISYQIYEDSTKPNTIFSVETWQNTSVEAAHFETEHIKIAFEKIGDLLNGDPIIFKGYQFA